MIEDIKYAVYSVGGDGKDVLSVAVDSHDGAKMELEKLKSGNGIVCVKIKKCKVENFGKEGEKILESEEVECWNKPADDAQKLSSLHQSTNGAASTPSPAAAPAPSPVTVSAQAGDNSMSAGGAVSEKDKELISFLNDYADNGDLMGLGYGFFKKKSANENGSASSMTTPVNANGNTSSTPSEKTFQVEGDEVKIKKDRLHKLKEELEGLTKEITEIEQAQITQVTNNNVSPVPTAAPAPVAPVATSAAPVIDKSDDKSDDDNRDDDDDDDKRDDRD